MDKSKHKFKTIDDYIGNFSKEVADILQSLRRVIKEEVPEAVEAISYQIPTFKLNGKNLVHFAGWKNHIGFYPAPSGIEAFNKELDKYKVAKGSIQFPIDQPLPWALIRKIVKFRVRESRERLFPLTTNDE